MIHKKAHSLASYVNHHIVSTLLLLSPIQYKVTPHPNTVDSTDPVQDYLSSTGDSIHPGQGQYTNAGHHTHLFYFDICDSNCFDSGTTPGRTNSAASSVTFERRTKQNKGELFLTLFELIYMYLQMF